MTASISHWHNSNCPGPQIEFEEHESSCEITLSCRLLPRCNIIPRCTACGQKPPIHDMLLKQYSSNIFVDRPEDQPPGQMNLYWPSRSLYHNSTDATPPDKEKLKQVLSNIYPTTLLPNQFRQALLSPTGSANFKHACLAAIDPEDYPIHLTLEAYEDNNCPEYEAFSYTWEGENPEKEKGPSMCRPMYIGPSWDVLMQARNCWELLRFARLSDVTRHVWVDAVCINQGNMEEKAHQVAKMGRIYRESSRVVVYLGPDIAVKPKARFPRRHDFGQLATGRVYPQNSDGSIMDLDIAKLFKTRYFTRLWVVQELVLSPRTVIRIGDIDVSVDSIIMKKLENTPGWDWTSTSAEWFQYVARQTLGRDPCEALQLVSNSNCSDLRDRLFGILWLMNPEDIIDRGVQADYSLSAQHTWIGFFAHCLLRLNLYWFLTHASGASTVPGGQQRWIPSWVPDWTSPGIWMQFRRPTLSYDEIADAMNDPLRMENPIKPSEPPAKPAKYRRLARPIMEQLISDPLTPWYQGAAVDAKTGALSHIQATYLLPIVSFPQLQTSYGEYGVYEIDLRAMHTRTQPRLLRDERLYLVSQQPLDKKVLPMRDYLYFLYTSHGLLFLILRHSRAPRFLKHRFGPGYFDMRGRQNFSLVAAVPYTFISFENRSSKSPKLATLKVRSIGDLPRVRTAEELIDIIRITLNETVKLDTGFFGARGSNKTLQNSKYRQFFLDDLPYGSSDQHFKWEQIFPGAENIDLLPLFWQISNEILSPESRSDEELKMSHIASVKRKFRPVVQEGYLKLWFQVDEWEQLGENYKADTLPVTLPEIARNLEWSYDNVTWSRNGGWGLFGIGDWFRRRQPIYIRAPWNLILSTIRMGKHTVGMARCIIWLRGVFNTDDLAVFQKKLADPGETYNHLKLEQGDFAVDGDLSTINIC
ncbi:heterokaryon incompatibility protein-domain-containing protein [Xylaria venustula]|nr:heterokaryon incompatibility protein-domain-containing protein [Xylaria venustula]